MPVEAKPDLAPQGQALTAVLIVNFNSGALLQQCLQAVSTQTRLPDRVLVVDNASQDDSLAAMQQTWPFELQLIRSDQNVGFAAGVNIGMTALKDMRFLAMLNPDAFPRQEWLAKLLEAATAQPAYGSYASRLMQVDEEDSLDGAGDIYHVSGLAWRRHHAQRRCDTETRSGAVFCACAAAALYRLDCLQEVGALDEDFFCYMEDIDLGWRLQLAGHPCWYVDDAVVEHVGSAVAGRHSDFQLYHGHRNLVWVFIKNMPGILFPLLLPLHLLLNIFSLLYFLARGRGGVIMRAKRDAAQRLAVMWRKRRQVQSRRALSVAMAWQMLDKRLWRGRFS